MSESATLAPRRTRARKAAFKIDKTEIVDRVMTFFEHDDEARSDEKEARIQRYAKFRMWVEGKDWPWESASDVPLPDMMEKSLRLQDTIHNAVMSSRPVMQAKAGDRLDKSKESVIDKLLDHQMFKEQSGEELIGDFADAFVNDGVVFAFTPWVRESREISEATTFPPIPEEFLPEEYFAVILRTRFSGAEAVPKGDGWEWAIHEGDDSFEVSFFTKPDGRVEMVRRKQVQIYDGPRVIQKEWDEVLYPPRAANLQRPGPSNPHGAPHVILVDYPTVDEVVALAKDGLYDRLTKDDLDALGVTARDTSSNQEMRDQKDVLQGTQVAGQDDRRVPEQKTLTRLTCFDVMDVDGDGIAEDVVWRIIKDTKVLARAALLTEDFPSSDGRRPIEHQSFMPVRGRVAGIGLLEMMEGLHDVQKTMLDQDMDAGTIKNVPFFFYRASGSMQPEIMRLSPGEGYPLNDPQRDVHFPQFRNDGSSDTINKLTIMQQWQDHLTTIGPLQLGDVPQGKASALRTVGGMSLIAGQGEARPERILRRFFLFLSHIWRHIHDLNRIFLPEEKKIRVVGLKDASDDPYLTISRDDVQGTYEFDFTANVLNTSKLGLQQSITTLLGTYVTPLMLQLGIIDPDGIYRLAREFGFAHGQDPDQYLRPPDADAFKPKISAEEAVSQIFDGQVPDGRPVEPGGAAEHLQKLVAFRASDNFGLLKPELVELFEAYLQQVVQRVMVEQQQAAAIQAAAQFQQQGQGQPGAPVTTPPSNDNGPPPVQGTELINESLPGAGGGANAA